VTPKPKASCGYVQSLLHDAARKLPGEAGAALRAAFFLGPLLSKRPFCLPQILIVQ